MRIILYLFLYLSIICSDIRKPSKYIRNSFKKSLGKKGFRILYNSFKKYHRAHGEATFPEFIKAKRPELNPMLNKFKKKGRKLSKKFFIEKLKAKNVKEDIINKIKNGNEENAITIYLNAVNKKKMCGKFIENLVKKYKNNQ